jgi:hypothetical protein
MRKILMVAVMAAASACGSSSSSSTTPTAATPVFSPAAGTYNAPQSVIITSATTGAAIHYTTDGSTPTASSPTYASAIAVAATTTVKALATAAGHQDSAVATATYTLQAAAPVFSLAPGSYATAQSVTITSATPGATIRYTTDGTAPTGSSPAYAGPISLPGPGPTTTTIRAIATRAGFTDSAVVSATYTIDTSIAPAATPTFTPPAGTYASAQSVTISSTTAGASIYFTTDGSDPTTLSTAYAAPVPVAATTTLKAIATATGFGTSAVATATYVITLPQAATPTFSPAPGTYASAQSVTLASTTAGAAIHYTTDGSVPTGSSPTYAGAIPVPSTTTIKAIATAAGYAPSSVASATYVIDTGGGTDFLAACTALFSAYQGLLETCTQANPAFLSAPGPFSGNFDCAGIQREITANLVAYDPLLGAACVSDAQALGCSALLAGGGLTIPASCEGSITGLVASGGSCYSSNDCAAGSCSSDFTATCPGTCQPFVALGGDCSSADCASGLTCDYQAMTPTCVTQGTTGSPCPCQEGLWCDTMGGTPGICTAPQTAGGICTADPASCAPGYECVGFTFFPPSPGTCQALVGGGAACGASVPCGLGWVCPSGTCVSVPSTGAACDPATTPFCIGGYCDFTLATPVCVAYKADGAPCADSGECASGNCGAGGLCAPGGCTVP